MKTDMLPSVTPQLVELEAFPFAVAFDDKSAMHISPKVYGASHNSKTLQCELWSLLLLHYQGHADSKCPSEDKGFVNILLGYVHAMR